MKFLVSGWLLVGQIILFEREKLSPGLGFEPRSPAGHAGINY